MAEISIKKAISIALETGRIMLANGAEVYRVEETIERMIASKHTAPVNVFVVSTGIIVSTVIEGDPYTVVDRTTSISLDLEVISRANAFSRLFTDDDMTEEHAEIILQGLRNHPRFPEWIRYLFSGAAGGFFVLLLGGTFIEFLSAYIASALVVMFSDALSREDMNFFIKNISGGLLAAGLALVTVLFLRLFGVFASYNHIVVGPLMTLVPGVALTNGIRDLISGELIAGSVKIMEALFIAIALAFGVGVVLQLSLAILGDLSWI